MVEMSWKIEKGVLLCRWREPRQGRAQPATSLTNHDLWLKRILSIAMQIQNADEIAVHRTSERAGLSKDFRSSHRKR